MGQLIEIQKALEIWTLFSGLKHNGKIIIHLVEKAVM